MPSQLDLSLLRRSNAIGIKSEADAPLKPVIAIMGTVWWDEEGEVL